jgi:hypothetical protein
MNQKTQAQVISMSQWLKRASQERTLKTTVQSSPARQTLQSPIQQTIWPPDQELPGSREIRRIR